MLTGFSTQESTEPSSKKLQLTTFLCWKLPFQRMHSWSTLQKYLKCQQSNSKQELSKPLIHIKSASKPKILKKSKYLPNHSRHKIFQPRFSRARATVSSHFYLSRSFQCSKNYILSCHDWQRSFYHQFAELQEKSRREQQWQESWKYHSNESNFVPVECQQHTYEIEILSALKLEFR